METDTVNLTFEPDTLNNLVDEEGKPFFTEDQKHRLPNLNKFKGEHGVAKIVKSFMELEKLHGTDMEELKNKYLAPLPEGATEEQRAEYNKKLAAFIGVPEKYEVKFPDDVPEGLKINDGHVEKFKELSKKHNLTQQATQELVDLQMEVMTSILGEHADKELENKEETERKLKSDWKGEEYPKRLELVKRLLRSRVNPDATNVKEEDDQEWQNFKNTVYASGIANNYVIMKVLGDAAENLIGTGTTVKSDGTIVVDKKSEREQHFPNSPEMDG